MPYLVFFLYYRQQYLSGPVRFLFDLLRTPGSTLVVIYRLSNRVDQWMSDQGIRLGRMDNESPQPVFQGVVPSSLGVYGPLQQTVCLTIAPAFIVAGIYLTLSRVVLTFGL